MRIAAIVGAVLFLVAALGISRTQSVVQHEDPAAVTPEHPLSFLEGHWRSESDGAVMDEFWFPHRAGATTGVLRWTMADGSVRMHELLAFTSQADGSIAYTMRHFSGDMQPWDSEKDGPFRGIVDAPEPGKLVIRCTEHNGSVEQLIYEQTSEQTGERTMRATLKFSEESGRQAITIDFDAVD